MAGSLTSDQQLLWPNLLRRGAGSSFTLASAIAVETRENLVGAQHVSEGPYSLCLYLLSLIIPIPGII